MDKLITDKGKTELLRLGFIDGSQQAFSYLALGGGDSEGAQGNAFAEVTSYNYERVPTTLEEEINSSEKQITISGVFEEGNYNPSDGGLIKEIGLCNSAVNSNNQIFFLYSEVPEIYKTDSISLKYTIVISIE